MIVNNWFCKKGILFLLLSVCCLSLFASAVISFADEEGARVSLWNDTADTAIVANEDGSITANAAFDDNGKALVTGGYYTENVASREALEKTGTISVCVEFSFADVVLNNHLIPFISNRPLTSWMGDVFAENGSFYLGNSDHLAGARIYYQTQSHYQSNIALIRVCDYANYRTANYFKNVSPTLQTKHMLRYLITETNLTMEFDGQPLTLNANTTSAYELQKAKDVNWTLSDFLDEEGNPFVYFGFLNSGFGNVTVYKVSDGDNTVKVGNFEGDEDALSERDGAAYLTNGSAYALQTYDASDLIQGTFAIRNVPAYVYEGVSEEERDPSARTWFRVNFKDSVAGLSDGNGFCITWYPLEETGESRTEIEFGYLGNGIYHSLKSFLVGVNAIGEHWFSVLSGDGWFRLIADGESVFVEIAADNGLYEMNENMDRDNMQLYYTADDGYPQTYPGKWEIALQDATVLSSESGYVRTGDVALSSSGEYRENTVEKDGRTYQIIEENKTLTLSGGEHSGLRDGEIYATVPVKLFSRLDVNLEMTLGIGALPVCGENGDSYIGLFFSACPGGTTDPTEEKSTFTLILRRNSESELSVYCKMGSETTTKTVVVSGEQITVSFGWSGSDSEIAIDGERLLVGLLTKGNFNSADGLQGYFSMKRYSEVAENWTVTVSAPRHKLVTADETPDNPENPDNPIEPENPNNPGKTDDLTGGCGASLGGNIAIICALSVGVAVVLLIRKKIKKY